jgi:hypothetical protein
MSPEKILETQARKLHVIAETEDIAILQETCHQLKAGFARVLFDLKNAPQDHYT